ncbi:hypothetical protein [Spirosoma pollinicola]|uniref:STAS/SEC14 domain-containing protein n=1 Tax=Spirosoma pollinicola TaxID=2057025 RepID=A0A2K8YYS0_9BACT|nr:hypothetical protein [Spirosoma pollinicola]AUD02780.1 hypothetical protein CWM47_13620 [Spirosoma pollinicola]
MKTYQNEHVMVNVECGIHLLQQTWTGIPTSENFRDGSLAIMALAKRHLIKRWSINLQQLRMFNPVDIHWFIQQWLPQSNPGLPQQVRVAVILTDLNQFSKLGADMVIRASTSLNEQCSSRYFIDDNESRQWLLRNT